MVDTYQHHYLPTFVGAVHNRPVYPYTYRLGVQAGHRFQLFREAWELYYDRRQCHCQAGYCL
jgi:hypothetical protein